MTHTWILLQWKNPCKSRKPCTGAADAAEAPTNWRNPLEHFVKVLVPLSAKAGSAGSSTVSVGGINHRTVLLRAAGTGKNQRDLSVPPVTPTFQWSRLCRNNPTHFDF